MITRKPAYKTTSADRSADFAWSQSARANNVHTHKKVKVWLGVTIVWMILLIVFTSPLLAQITAGRIGGTVTDTSGAVVPGATITVTSNATGIVQTVNSGSSGDYLFQAVYPGVYTLKAKAPGFQQFIDNGIHVNTQNNTAIDVKLTVGTVDQKVTVTAAAPLLQTQDASVGQTVSGQQVNDMPLQVRDWTTLGLLAAGTTTTGSSTNPQFNVMGQNSTQNDFRLNGIDDNVEVYGGGTIEGVGATSGSANEYTAVVPPPDAIQEFKLQTGDFSAEFGHSTGGIVNASIKSGANRVSGDLWEYVRNTIFNANDYFANQQHIPRPAYHQNQFGGTVGGPVFIPKIYNGRNKTFFFFDYQGTRIDTPSSYQEYVPTMNIRNSNFTNYQDYFTIASGTKTDALGRKFPYATFFDPATTRQVAAGAIDPVSGLPNTTGNAIYVRDPFYTNGSIAGITNFTGDEQYLNQLPASRIDPNAQKLMALYPAPTIVQPTFPNYYSYPGTTNDINQYDIRIDEHISDKDFLFGVFDRSDQDIYVPPPFPGIADGQDFGDGPNEGPRYAIALSYTHVFTSTLSNEAHAGWTQTLEHLAGPNGSTLGIPAQFGIAGVPQSPGNGGLPPIGISALTGLGEASYMPTLETTRTLEISDNMTKVYNTHSFKTGFQINNFHAPIIQPPYGKGTFTFSGKFSDIPNQSTGYAGAADLLLVPVAATVPNGVSDVGGLSSYALSNYAEVSDQRYYMGAYFQDDWRATPNLTLNLGLRWDHYTPYQEIHGRQANFIETGGGAGNSGTYYIAQRGCSVPQSATFAALLASYNINIACTPNNATGEAQNLNFAPRVGFAYRIDPRWVVRGGYGLTYGALDNIGFGPVIGNNYPFAYTVSYSAPTSQTPLTVPGGQTAVLENALAAQNLESPTVVNGTGLSLQGRQYNFQTPYQETANLTIQDQFTQHDSASIAYVGTFGRHLDSQGTQNSPSAIMPPGTNDYSTSVQGHIPFPNLAANSAFMITSSVSSYNSMQIVYQHQLSAGLTLLANYTWAKCMTDERASQAQGEPGYRAEWLPGFGIQADTTLCSSDVAQVVHASGTYNLPVGRHRQFLSSDNRLLDAFVGGWVTNFIYSHQTGGPFTINCPVGTTADFGCFANKVPGQNLYAGPHNVHQWLNPEAFVNPPVATVVGQTSFAPLGGSPNQARGPSFQDLDMSLFKEFALESTFRFEFRAEAFNLPNSTSFGTPTNLNFQNTTNFSEITYDRNNARILQLALKLYF
jgi:hypothetical protein